jgi:glycosyltransferase involved in cell wall biosynthesis
MNAGFVHSHRFKEHKGAVYSDGKLPYKTWLRYLRHFDRLTVMARHELIREFPDRLNLSSGENITFEWLPDLNAPLRYLQERKRCTALMRNTLANLDALIIRSSSQGWIAAAEAQRQHIPWAVEVVGDPWDALWNYGNLAGKLFAPIAWWQARKWISRAPYAIYVTRQQLQHRYPCTGKTAYASDVEVYPVDRSVIDNRLSMMLCDRPAPLKCGMIGSLVNRYKGLHVALKSLHQLRNHGLDIHLHVLGEGKLEEWTHEAQALGIADLLHLDGTLPSGAPVCKWLESLDFYIQPSLTEGLPRALIEAMSRGLPSLGSACGGIPELLPNECLHHPGDFKILAQHMHRMVHDEDWRCTLAKRNFAEAQKYYADVIDERRNKFWAEFAAFAREEKARYHPCAS